MTMSKDLVDGLLKAAVKLTPQEKRRQALQFAGLGMATIPGLALAQNKIREGRWLPKSGKLRFLAAAGLGGAFWGGVLPTIQHGIAQSNLSKARARVRAEKELHALAGPQPVHSVVKQLPLHGPADGAVAPPAAPVVKTGASKLIARLKGNLKVRQGRRPMRVHNLLKKEGSDKWQYVVFPTLAGAATLGGVLAAVGPRGRKQMASEIRDPRMYSNLRGMVTGESREERVKAHKGLRKADSILSAMRSGFSREKKASQSGADLRLPVMGGTKFPTNDSLAQAKQKLKEHQDVAKPKMVRPTVQPVYGVNMPKFAFADDPLVQYLKKTATEVKDNEGDMKTGPSEEAHVDACPVESSRGNDKTHSEWRQSLNELFSNKSGITKKYMDKERGTKGHA